MTAVLVVGLILALGWAALAVAAWWINSATLRDTDEVLLHFLLRFTQTYTRVLHKVRYEGLEHVPRRTFASHPPGGGWVSDDEPPIIVVCNHTAGIDPLLVQCGMPFEVRWMMAEDMRLPVLEWFWRVSRVIFVDRERQSGTSVRAAVAHLKHGGCIGIFPEGHIARPPETLLPFKEGIGLLVRRAKAMVLPVVISGTPPRDPAWASLWLASESVVRFLPPINYAHSKLSAAEIRTDIFERFKGATGWPEAERVPQVIDERLYVVGMDGRYHDAEQMLQPLEPEFEARVEAMNA
ncbi:MAG: lysophospholipid acyltransferase family protein [Planctomycetota bacterium]